MVKKIFTKKEITKRLSPHKTTKGRIEKIKSWLSKENLLSNNTKDVLYVRLGKEYLKDVGNKSPRQYAIQLDMDYGDAHKSNEIYLEMLSAAEAYAKSGNFGKASRLVKNADQYRNMITCDREGYVRQVFDAFPERSTKMREDILNKKRFQKKRRSSHLEKTVTTVFIAFSLIIGLFFLSPNLTGNVVADLTTTSSNGIGIILIVVGIVGALFYFRKK